MIKASRYALCSGAPKNSPAHLETGAKLLLWSEKRTSIRDRVSDPVWNGSTETTLKGMPPPFSHHGNRSISRSGENDETDRNNYNQHTFDSVGQ